MEIFEDNKFNRVCDLKGKYCLVLWDVGDNARGKGRTKVGHKGYRGLILADGASTDQHLCGGLRRSRDGLNKGILMQQIFT